MSGLLCLPRRMRVWSSPASGGPEVLKRVEEEMPQPGPEQARVKVLAAGVAYADVLMRRGLYPGVPPFPFAAGYDIVGDIGRILPHGKKATWYNVKTLVTNTRDGFAKTSSNCFSCYRRGKFSRWLQPGFRFASRLEPMKCWKSLKSRASSCCFRKE